MSVFKKACMWFILCEPLLAVSVRDRLEDRGGTETDFYIAALREDLGFLEDNFKHYSIHRLKIVLNARHTGKWVSIYDRMKKGYYKSDPREPFAEVLQYFPSSSAQLLSDLLIKDIRLLIAHRKRCAYGLAEVTWLEEELRSLERAQILATLSNVFL